MKRVVLVLFTFIAALSVGPASAETIEFLNGLSTITAQSTSLEMFFPRTLVPNNNEKDIIKWQVTI